MATTYYNAIQSLYVAYFNRPADPAGLQFWETNVEAAGGSTAAISAQFAASAEYKSLYANMTNEQIVDAVYHNLFGRAAEAEGKAYWAGLMTEGKITIDAVVADISKAALGSDKTAFTNKVTGAVAFTNALDTDAEKAAYNADTIDMGKDFISNITTDDTLAAAVAPATLNATIGDLVVAGTAFTVTGALANLDAAQTALDNFVASIDLDDDATTDTTPAQIKAEVGVAEAAVTGKMSAEAVALYTKTGTSDATKTALINAQVADNAAALADDQKALTKANADIAEVDGLSAAVANLAAVTKALTSAQAAQKAADADLAAKAASFEITTGHMVVIPATTGTTPVDGKIDVTVTTSTGSTTKTVATIDAKTGVATLADGVDASKYAGLSDYLTSYNTDVAAANATAKATTAVSAAQLTVNHLDIDDTVVYNNGAGITGTEKALLDQVTSQINHFTADTVATGSTASEAQITTELAVVKAQFGDTSTEYTGFKALVDAYHEAAKTNTLVQAQTDATSAVSTATKAITTFNGLVSDLATAKEHAADLAGYQATVDAAEALFKANDYHLVNIDADVTAGVTSEIGSADNDIFVVGKEDTSINLFGLQGHDSLFIGTGYTLVQGAASTKNADNATLQAFVSQDGNDTVIQLESHAFSSSVKTTPGEIVTITLVGVTATDVHLDANGIVTVGGTTA